VDATKDDEAAKGANAATYQDAKTNDVSGTTNTASNAK